MLLFLLACLDDALAPGAEDAFVAMQSDFSGYPSWESYPVADLDTGHGEGSRTVYLNQAASGAAFPVGTILVKVITGGETFAMVKRGGDFNTDGAYDWEWFELVAASDGTPVIKWRGDEPPAGEQYGALPGQQADTAIGTTGDCDTCHSGARSNDYVFTVPLGG